MWRRRWGAAPRRTGAEPPASAGSVRAGRRLSIPCARLPTRPPARNPNLRRRARLALEKRAAAKSQQVLHERIRHGVAVGRSAKPTAKQQARAARAAAKAEKRAAQAALSEAYLARRAGGRGKRLGRRQAAVEAQWGNSAGQFKR